MLGAAPEHRNIEKDDETRIQRQPGPGHTVCPYSGVIAADEEFVYPGDVQAAIKQLKWEAAADVKDHLATMARDFNRQQPRGSLISLKIDIKRNRRPRPVVLREDLLRNLVCDICSRSYAVYAIGLFCPDCGAPNVALHFKREIELVKAQVDIADKQAIDGKSEIAYRLMGNACEDVLTAFEATVKAVYRYLVKRHLSKTTEDKTSFQAIGTGCFQSIERTRKLFQNLSFDPFTSMSDSQIDIMRSNIQKRHIIGHNLGIADERFAQRTDHKKVGQTVRIIGRDVLEFAESCRIVIRDLDTLLAAKSLPENSATET